MTTTLRFFSTGLSVAILVSAAQAQTRPTFGDSAPNYMPLPQGDGSTAIAAPDQSMGAPRAMPASNPGMLQPLPAENIGRRSSPDEAWLLVAPYGWMPGIKGTIASGTRSADVDLSVGDAIRKVLPDLRGAAMLHVEGGVNDVGFITDLMYLNARPLDGLFRVESKSTFLELLGFYRLLNTGPCPGGCTLDVLAGARYYNFTNTITVQPIDLTPSNKTNAWWDLVVGLRGSVQVTDCLALFARGDYGGFDIDGSSKRACNALVGFDWQCTDCVSIYGGYRWFKIDRTDGAGPDLFKLDVTLSGPFVGVGVHF